MIILSDKAKLKCKNKNREHLSQINKEQKFAKYFYDAIQQSGNKQVRLEAGVYILLQKAIKGNSGAQQALKEFADLFIKSGIFREGWKNVLRMTDHGTHEMIPCELMGEVILRSLATKNPNWFKYQCQCRIPTNYIVFDPYDTVYDAIGNNSHRILCGHPNSVVIKNKNSTHGSSEFHDQLLYAFDISKNLKELAILHTEIMKSWLWDGKWKKEDNINYTYLFGAPNKTLSNASNYAKQTKDHIIDNISIAYKTITMKMEPLNLRERKNKVNYGPSNRYQKEKMKDFYKDFNLK